MSDAAKIYPQPEYIFTIDDPTMSFNARFAAKYFSLSKVISLDIIRGGINTDYTYEIFMAHLPELQEVYESLIDKESKKIFCGYWLGKTSAQLGKFVYSNTPHYICTGFIPERGGIVIEGGTCDGATAALFTARGYKVYTFEMDKKNYKYCRAIAKEKKFVLENFGLGAYNHEANYNSRWGSSNLTVAGNETARIITLDSYVDEKNLPSVDFIKLDVEGAELDVLRGAAMTIARFKPILALSAYHKIDDFWTLMNFIKSIRPDYEFALRQFADTVETVPSVFNDEMRKQAISLGLEPEFKSWYECVLFAR